MAACSRAQIIDFMAPNRLFIRDIKGAQEKARIPSDSAISSRKKAADVSVKYPENKNLNITGIMVPVGYRVFDKRIKNRLFERNILYDCLPDQVDRYGDPFGMIYLASQISDDTNTDDTSIGEAFATKESQQAASSLQADLLAMGLAFTADVLPPGPDVAELLDSERKARSAKVGLWLDGSPFLWRLDADGLPLAQDGSVARTGAPGRFRIVEGRVASSALIGEKLLINMGDNYRTDVTLEVPSRLVRKMRKEGLIDHIIAGQFIQFRGRFDYFNGPRFVLADSRTLVIGPRSVDAP